jgi:hypothetical protein
MDKRLISVGHYESSIALGGEIVVAQKRWRCAGTIHWFRSAAREPRDLGL